MKINIKQLDAFTNVPFGGNPAGVVLEADDLDGDLKQKIAREMNLSETAFVSKSDNADFKVEFFTPQFEVDLCGHATIATFSCLYEEGKINMSKKVYYQETKAGILPVEIIKDDGEVIFMMEQALPKFEEIDIKREELANILRIDKSDLLDVPLMKVSTGIWWLVVGIRKLDKLINMKPDFKAVENLSRKYNFIGITPFSIKTLDVKNDYHIRAFAPLAGVNEDPVCGTGNGSVASYIAYNNIIAFKNRLKVTAEQGLEVNRPGSVYVEITREKDRIEQIKIGGTAITILEGYIKI